ncbi:branched-chain amino acid transport system II carrier protein [Acinetobacter rathckeae]|uniref:branched-chain amino acid transport system II carrier protein n=1 Tax=Acinetobacter rathckeae TaxID=2605272 RepID=UPI0018A2C62D|nr:branched-chain amino acid transport system II carrier protein [Acinetobacter rathckeae]MBF7687272.1 branched-chain amino acid transport system II carrier protein [Acinetobacter rathckeae]MBF7694375.1 branched-chain amino acid transport system II carrier protein [Acinetobacter rathckeae]
MTQLNLKDILALGFMTFALFIGAGNIIFPPIVAQQAGEHVWLAAFGFLITAVGLPVLTIIALARVGGSIEALSSPLGKIASLILTVTCYLAVGPLFATPRTATVSYAIGIEPHFGHGVTPTLIYSAIYFTIVAIVSLYPHKILDTIGYVLAPLKLVALSVLCISTLFISLHFFATPTGHYVDRPMSEGLVNGYLTMDTLGALVFGIVIVQAVQSRGVTASKFVFKYTVIASMIAGVGLTALYLCLFRLGVQSYPLTPNATNGAVILNAYVQHAFGSSGTVFLTALIILACVVTAIGLTCSCASYFHQLTKISYKTLVIILVVFAFLISNLGLDQLIAFSVPVLTAIYPPAIVVILLSFFTGIFSNPTRIFIPVTTVAFIFGVIEGIKASRFQHVVPDILQKLPLSEQNLAWLIPCVIVFVIALVLNKIKKS